mmetsp:Transcript_20654/g.22999  ORF Transcript_20654/g.22999 Transcript_20654/m.22999 type:complete len:151 (+) Transcript_20654:23-475(+)
MESIHNFREIDLISDNLYLGDYTSACDQDILDTRGITHILTVGSYLSPKFLEKYKYKILEIDDSDETDIKQFFEEGIEFINEALNSDGAILIHCMAGISRSATMTIAYLMNTNQWKYRQALIYVRGKRLIIDPNQGFEDQLIEYETELGV